MTLREAYRRACFHYSRGVGNPSSIMKCLFRDFEARDLIPVMGELKALVEGIASLPPEELEKLSEEGETQVIGSKPRVTYLESIGEGPFVTRFAPSPSGLLHLAHDRILHLNRRILEEKGGETILRIEDTDPGKPNRTAEILEDLRGYPFGRRYVQSERAQVYSENLEALFAKGEAFHCTCSQEELRGFRERFEECPHYSQSFTGEEGWERFKASKAGIAKIRGVRGNDPSTFELVLARFKGGSLTPMMNFCVAIDDYLMGVNLSIRGKDHISNAMKQDRIREAMGVDHEIKCIFLGLCSIEGEKLSSSQMVDEPNSPLIIRNFKRDYCYEELGKFWEAKGISPSDLDIPPLKTFRSRKRSS